MITSLFVYIVASACLASLVVVLVLVLGTNAAETEKLSSYECGFEPFGDARESFDITFYLVGRLFRIFDIEIAFLFPWSVLVLTGSKLLVWLIFSFSFVLIVGFALEMVRGVLDWKWKSISLFMLTDCVSTDAELMTHKNELH